MDKPTEPLKASNDPDNQPVEAQLIAPEQSLTLEKVRQPTRGEFLKWSALALSGVYVSPRIASFAVSGTIGQAGSPPPGPPPSSPPSAPPPSGPPPSSPPSSGPPPSSPPSHVPSLPPTGGAAGSSGASDNDPHWLPVAGAGAATAGWLLHQRRKRQNPAKGVARDDAKTTD